MNRATIRKRSQRSCTLSGKHCEKCGSMVNLQRHHPNYDSEAFIILCQGCHTLTHLEVGTWGSGSKKMKNCVVCGSEFLPRHSKKHSTCSRTCLSELGKRNAMKRWGKRNQTFQESL